MLIKFTSDVLLGTGLGIVVGAFLPAIGRKIKSEWVKETQAFEKKVYRDYDKTKEDLKSKL